MSSFLKKKKENLVTIS